MHEIHVEKTRLLEVGILHAVVKGRVTRESRIETLRLVKSMKGGQVVARIKLVVGEGPGRDRPGGRTGSNRVTVSSALPLFSTSPHLQSINFPRRQQDGFYTPQLIFGLYIGEV